MTHSITSTIQSFRGIKRKTGRTGCYGGYLPTVLALKNSFLCPQPALQHGKGHFFFVILNNYYLVLRFNSAPTFLSRSLLPITKQTIALDFTWTRHSHSLCIIHRRRRSQKMRLFLHLHFYYLLAILWIILLDVEGPL